MVRSVASIMIFVRQVEDDVDYFELPQRVAKLHTKNIVGAACGLGHTAAWSDDGLMFTWGS